MHARRILHICRIKVCGGFFLLPLLILWWLWNSTHSHWNGERVRRNKNHETADKNRWQTNKMPNIMHIKSIFIRSSVSICVCDVWMSNSRKNEQKHHTHNFYISVGSFFLRKNIIHRLIHEISYSLLSVLIVCFMPFVPYADLSAISIVLRASHSLFRNIQTAFFLRRPIIRFTLFFLYIVQFVWFCVALNRRLSLVYREFCYRCQFFFG